LSQAPGEAARDAATQAKDRVAEQGARARDVAQSRLRAEMDSRSTQAAEQVSTTATAVREMGDQLRSQGQGGAARISDELAGRMEQMGGYLRESDAEAILHDAEDFARKQPWLVIATGIVIGVAGARFLKASSRRRYQSAGSLRPQGPDPARSASLPRVTRLDDDETPAGASARQDVGPEPL
jgi:ElaB/YqjD/DUF883 family membrane-anchored ribosome-binding protein